MVDRTYNHAKNVSGYRNIIKFSCILNESYKVKM